MYTSLTHHVQPNKLTEKRKKPQAIPRQRKKGKKRLKEINWKMTGLNQAIPEEWVVSTRLREKL